MAAKQTIKSLTKLVWRSEVVTTIGATSGFWVAINCANDTYKWRKKTNSNIASKKFYAECLMFCPIATTYGGILANLTHSHPIIASCIVVPVIIGRILHG